VYKNNTQHGISLNCQDVIVQRFAPNLVHQFISLT